MGVVKDIQLRTTGTQRKRVCDLQLHDNGKIYLVDIKEEKGSKKKYSVCINEALMELLKEIYK